MKATDAIVKEIDGAQSQVLVQVYSFTSKPIAEALVRAKNRGRDVQIIIDSPSAKGKGNKVQMCLDADMTCPPKTDPHVKLEWIEGRQGDEQEAVYSGADSWKAAGSRGGLGARADIGPGLP